MKKIVTYSLLGLVAMISACSKINQGESDQSFKKGEGGLFYRIVEDKDTPEVGEISFVSVSYTEVTENGTVISQTGKLDPRPSMIFARLPDFKGDFHDALQYLSAGDSAIIKINIDSLKKIKGLQLNPSDTSKFMVFHVRINNVINKNSSKDTLYPSQIERYKHEQNFVHKATEKEKIRNYLSMVKKPYVATSSGLLIPSNIGKPVGRTDRKQKVMYAFYTLDGKLMDTNREGLALSKKIYSPGEEYAPLEISIENAPIAAFKEALSVLPSGEKINMIIPSSLAFGDSGNSKDIPAFMPLVCEFEILK